MAIKIDNQEYYTIDEVCKLTKRKKTTVYQSYKKWGLTKRYYDRYLIFKKEEVNNWIKENM